MAADQNTHPYHEVLEACYAALKQCRRTLATAVAKSPEAHDPRIVGALLDCISLNSATIDLLTRDSPLAEDVLKLNADAAAACARAIEGHDHEDGQLRATYAACLGAADSPALFDDLRKNAEEKAQDKTIADSFPASDPPPTPGDL